MDGIDGLIDRLRKSEERLKEAGQGRVYNVGTKVLYDGKFGVVTDLNQGSEDPAGTTVDVRLADGTQIEKVKVDSVVLELFRS